LFGIMCTYQVFTLLRHTLLNHMHHPTFPQRLGILGGGQLARMTLQAAVPFGIDTVILADAPDSPAGRVAGHEVVGDWQNETALRRFADLVDVVTLENEFVDAAVLEHLKEWGKQVRPGALVLQAIQDKLIQKQTLADAGLPVPRFAAIASPNDIEIAAASYGWPLILKARRNGYDGYGNAALHAPQDIVPALDRLGWPQRELLAEQMVPFVHELAVLVARGVDGACITYPVVETVQHNHICHIVRAPAQIPASLAQQATAVARAAAETVGGIGITAVELFQTTDDQIVINELAPRPHNSGHFSINACYTSQFENHLRAVLGLPLGDPSLRVHAAVMINLLGTRDGVARLGGLADALRVPGVHGHVYGKRDVRRGRKMGHLTALGTDLHETEARALAAAQMIEM
jgi:5-(carboxyamino)imidazole ribonucleotide synthase